MRLTVSKTSAGPSEVRRQRRGVSLVEIIVAMTLLSFVIGAMSLASTKLARRGTDVDLRAARTFVLISQANRFASLPYDSLKNYANTTDSINDGRFYYFRTVSYVQGTTSEYKTMKVLLKMPQRRNNFFGATGYDTLKDSLVFRRTKTYDHTPLFNK